MNKQIIRFCKIFFRFILILLLLWILLGLIQTLVAFSLKLGYSDSLFFAGVGFCFGLIIFSMLSTFPRVYVFGHEFTHWFVAKLFRRKTSGFTVGKGQGSVRVEKPNIWIVLAPYFLPLYTVLWLVVIKSIEWVSKTEIQLPLVFGGVGITYAYHVVMTILALSRNQSDLKLNGNIFSVCLILTMNFSILFLGLISFTNNMTKGYKLLNKTYAYQLKVLKYILKKELL